MRYSILYAFALTGAALFSSAPSVAQHAVMPDLGGWYKLIKGTCIYNDAKVTPLVFTRGTLVVEQIDSSSFAYYGALTPKGYTTVGRTGIYSWQQDRFAYAHPAGWLSSAGSALTVRQDTLLEVVRYDNATDTVYWKRVPAGSVTDKFQLKQVAKSQELFEYQKKLSY